MSVNIQLDVPALERLIQGDNLLFGNNLRDAWRLIKPLFSKKEKI